MRQRTRRSLLVSSALLALGGASVVLTGCSDLNSMLTHRETVEYSDLKDAAARKSDYFALNVPEWVPADATSIKITIRTDGPGYLLRFRSEIGLSDIAGCAAASEEPPVSPAITADWWPEELPTDGRLQCGNRDMEIAHDKNVWYAWTGDTAGA